MLKYKIHHYDNEGDLHADTIECEVVVLPTPDVLMYAFCNNTEGGLDPQLAFQSRRVAWIQKLEGDEDIVEDANGPLTVVEMV